MRTYMMENRGKLPLYEYLYLCIRNDILSGELRTGEKLPSKRALAEHLHISVITVENAYAQLTAEGYLQSQPKRGFFVSKVEPRSVSPHPPVLPEVPGGTRTAWLLDLKANRIDGTRFPFSTWSRLTRQVLREEGASLLLPLPPQGYLPLRQAIAEDLREYRGMAVSPEQILIGAGAEYLYLLLAQLLGHSSIFAVEDPGYPKIAKVYQQCGVSCVPVPLDQHGLSLSALKKSRATVAHISPSHHYPTGLITPIRRRQELLRWAENTNSYIIEDDYDSEFRFSGRPLPTLQSIDSSGRVIYMNTFSQTIAPSMRIGFLVLPPQLLEEYRRRLDFYACPVPATEQSVLARFIAGGQYEQHLSRMRNEYRSRRLAVLDAFRKSSFSQKIALVEQAAGLHFLLQLDTRHSDEELKQWAEQCGVRLSFLSEYARIPQASFAHTLVINYAGLSPEQLPASMELLGKVFSHL